MDATLTQTLSSRILVNPLHKITLLLPVFRLPHMFLRLLMFSHRPTRERFILVSKSSKRVAGKTVVEDVVFSVGTLVTEECLC